jgi:hypothetical protein
LKDDGCHDYPSDLSSESNITGKSKHHPCIRMTTNISDGVLCTHKGKCDTREYLDTL